MIMKWHLFLMIDTCLAHLWWIFLFGKDMKKFLIIISPLCVILFVLMCISCGLKGALAFFGAMLFAVALIYGLVKWAEFVDKHIKD